MRQSTSFYEAVGRVLIKSEAEIETMALAGRKASECLEWILGEIEPGITHVEWGPHGEVLMPPLPGGRSAPAKKTPGGRCP